VFDESGAVIETHESDGDFLGLFCAYQRRTIHWFSCWRYNLVRLIYGVGYDGSDLTRRIRDGEDEPTF
jgi:hypothetical protein